ncbi:MAG: hypothetical protein HY055_12730 [Magnetospirillum sp.]|nr:hypothetical protein [Magnetospirillum sp.]
MGRLTLPRVRALYRKWRRYPPPALAASIFLKIKDPPKRKGLGDFLRACGFDVGKGGAQGA